jgi:hypothetical protein
MDYGFWLCNSGCNTQRLVHGYAERHAGGCKLSGRGYQRRYGKENPEFVVKCCNTVLQYHPANVNAMLTKAEAQKYYIRSLMKSKNVKKAEELFEDSAIKTMYAEMEEAYVRLHESDYRRMPEEMYLQWMGLLKTDPDMYVKKLF